MKFGILREEKIPTDNRVPLTPEQCVQLKTLPGVSDVVVQTSPHRCFKDSEYQALSIPIVDSLQDCDVILGVKEVPVSNLLEHKIYFFFSHTIKKQPYNRGLLQTILQKSIQLIDYEVITNEQGQRIIAFGRWAGIVGAHNGLRAYGKRTGLFTLPKAEETHDFEALKKIYTEVSLPPMRIAVTGNGRVAMGAMELLEAAGVTNVKELPSLKEDCNTPCVKQLDVNELYHRKSDHGFDLQEFFTRPELYDTSFTPFLSRTDVMINAIYWDPKAPIYFEKEVISSDDFVIQTIADVTCDIEGSIPITYKATTIADPVMGVDRKTFKETSPYQPSTVDVMSVDNLPNELPRDASTEFGSVLVNQVLPELLKPNSPMIERASITKSGHLTSKFHYLKDYVEG